MTDRTSDSISLQRYPQYDPALYHPEAERQMKILQAVVTEIRTWRATHKINKKVRLCATLRLRDTSLAEVIDGIEKLGNVMLMVLPIEGAAEFNIQFTTKG